MKKTIFIFAVATLLMASCEKGGESVVANPDEIRFETSISRVAGTTFEEGDTFGLYAVEYNGEEVADLQVGGNYLNNEAVTLTGGVWTPSRKLYWSAAPCDFYAIYPQQNVEAMEDVLFHIATDQSQPSAEGVLGGYEASDIMWAKADTFEAIVVPQFIERSTPLVEVTMEGIAYLLEYDMSFRPGIQQAITVTLNTSPDQEKIEIGIEGDVDTWD